MWFVKGSNLAWRRLYLFSSRTCYRQLIRITYYFAETGAVQVSYGWPPIKLGVNMPARKKNPVSNNFNKSAKKSGLIKRHGKKNYGRKAEKHWK
ncbi:hypothetical protein HanIR_Chr03g0108181 [Helianthus annuus]|nr:hypothetical protein HanIR_Chr03g0108181 [Helianthus annuus]